MLFGEKERRKAPLARRDLLIAALEEDAIGHCLTGELIKHFNGDGKKLLVALSTLEAEGLIEAYRYGNSDAGEEQFVTLPIKNLSLDDVTEKYDICLCSGGRVPNLIAAILELPHPPKGDPLRIIGIWN